MIVSARPRATHGLLEFAQSSTVSLGGRTLDFRRMRERAIVWADDYSIVDTQRSATARRGAERSTDGCQVAGMFLRATATAGVALAEVLLRTDIDPRTPFMHDA
jgi:hypothetical protein